MKGKREKKRRKAVYEGSQGRGRGDQRIATESVTRQVETNRFPRKNVEFLCVEFKKVFL